MTGGARGRERKQGGAVQLKQVCRLHGEEREKAVGIGVRQGEVSGDSAGPWRGRPGATGGELKQRAGPARSENKEPAW